MKSVAVYCGASAAAGPAYYDAARQVGQFFGSRGIRIVYGGGSTGMMGAVADAALAAGGEVVGVIPEKLMALEVGHKGLQAMHVMPDMHSRKAKMIELSDAFVTLPGGYGTLEELFEVVTWAQLNYHLNPVGLLNVEGYFDHLIAFVAHCADVGFVRPQLANLITADTDIERLWATLESFEVPLMSSWT